MAGHDLLQVLLILDIGQFIAQHTLTLGNEQNRHSTVSHIFKVNVLWDDIIENLLEELMLLKEILMLLKLPTTCTFSGVPKDDHLARGMLSQKLLEFDDLIEDAVLESFVHAC